MTVEEGKSGLVCPQCGAAERADEGFCGLCGTALAGPKAPARLYALAAGAVTLPPGGAPKRTAKAPRHYAGHAALVAGRYREAVEWFDSVLRFVRPARSGPESIGAWIYLGVSHACLGECSPANDACAAAARQLDKHPLPGALRQLTLARGFTALQQADWAKAAEILAPVAQVSAAEDDRFSEGLAMVLRGRALAMEGAAKEALALADRGLARLEALGPLAGQSLWIAAHGEALRACGDLQRARASAERALALAASGDRWGEALAERTLGQCLMGGIEVDAAEVAGHLERAIELAIERGARADLAMARYSLAELCLMEENWDACRTELDQTSWLSLGLEMPWLRDRATALRARMPRKDKSLQPPTPKLTVPGDSAN